MGGTFWLKFNYDDIFGPEKFWAQKMSDLKLCLVQKQFGLQKNFGPKISGPKKIGSYSLSQKLLRQKDLGL